jgi:hypothetical protein
LRPETKCIDYILRSRCGEFVGLDVVGRNYSEKGRSAMFLKTVSPSSNVLVFLAQKAPDLSNAAVEIQSSIRVLGIKKEVIGGPLCGGC